MFPSILRRNNNNHTKGKYVASFLLARRRVSNSNMFCPNSVVVCPSLTGNRSYSHKMMMMTHSWKTTTPLLPPLPLRTITTISTFHQQQQQQQTKYRRSNHKNNNSNCNNNQTRNNSSMVPSQQQQQQSPQTQTPLVSSDGVVATKPIDFDIQATIEGNESQIVIIKLYKGQVLRAESGAMLYMTNGITMNTTTGGGISAGFSRMLTGQNFFISDYKYEPETMPTTNNSTTSNADDNDSYGTVALGTDFPSKIIRLTVSDYGDSHKIICQKGALLCASHTIDIQMEFSKNLSTGFFGGEGFVLQGLIGNGDVFLKGSGTIIKRVLKENERLRISSGCLIAFTSGVDYDVQMVQGFTNVIAGGEGLFMTTLTGPGTVWIQGQPPSRMISEISRRVPSGGGGGFIIPVGGGGGGGSSGGGGGDNSSST